MSQSVIPFPIEAVSQVRVKSPSRLLRLLPPPLPKLDGLGDTLRHLHHVLFKLVGGPPQPVAVVVVAREMRRSHAEVQQEINGSKGLLLEIVRRAAYDWVLYRSSTRIVNRKLAEESYFWLFVEKPGTPEWREREANGKFLTSFISICEALDLDPDVMRKHIRLLTAKSVRNVGRPAEYRRTEQRLPDDHNVNGLPAELRDDNDSFVAFEDLVLDDSQK